MLEQKKRIARAVEAQTEAMPKLPEVKTAESDGNIFIPSADQLRTAIKAKFGATAAMLAAHEALKTSPYRDVDANGTDHGVAIGVGRNLDRRGISVQEALLMYWNDLNDSYNRLPDFVPEFLNLKEERRAVLVDMAHSLDPGGLGKFKRLRKALSEGNWPVAVYEMGDSLWYEQQPRQRSSRLMVTMLTGMFEEIWGRDEKDQREIFQAAERYNFQAAIGLSQASPVQILAKYVPQGPRRPKDA